MTFDLKLDRLAIHYVDRKMAGPRYARAEKDVNTLHPAVRKFFLDVSAEIWEAPNEGATRSATFVESGHPRIKESAVRPDIEQVIAGTGDFFTISKTLARHLHTTTPAQVKRPSVFTLMRMTDSEGENCFVNIVKIRHDDREFVRLLADDLTELDVETVQNMLLQEIQKGACIPYPEREDYHLKVIDRQATDDPAQYFTENFLGCLAKMSDKYQATRIVPELQRFAREKKLPMARENLPDVIDTLRRKDGAVTTETVVTAVEQHRVYGDGFKREDLTTFIEQESRLGPIHIPHQAFAGRGKTGEKPRQLTYHFRDPELRGVTLSGPPGVLERVTSTDGDAVTFHIETHKNGYRTTYE